MKKVQWVIQTEGKMGFLLCQNVSRVLEQRALWQSKHTCNNTRTTREEADKKNKKAKIQHDEHKSKSWGTKLEKVGRRTNWVRNHDCVQNVTAGRRLWTLLIAEKEKNTVTDGNADSSNKHTHLSHLINAYLPVLTAALSFPCPWDVTS